MLRVTSLGHDTKGSTVRIEWVLLCRYAEANEYGGTLVGVGAETFAVTDFPAVVSLGTAVGLRLAPHDRSTVVDVSFRVLDQEMAEVARETVTVRLGPPQPAHPEGWEYASLYSTTTEFLAAEAGTYTLEVAAEGGLPFTLTFSVAEV